MAASKPSLIFDHSPFQHIDDLCKKSFLGGMPELPVGIDWPRNAQKEPLHFLAQIDFDEVNERCSSSDIQLNIKRPITGRILLFADALGDSLWDDDNKAAQIIFFKKDIGEVSLQSSPVDLKSPLLGEGASYSLDPNHYRPLATPGRMPQHFPRVHMSMRLVESQPIDYEASSIYLSEHFEVPESIKNEFNYEHNRSFPYFRWPWLIKNTRDDYFRRKTIDIPEGYPWNWCVIESTCQQIHSEVQRVQTSSSNSRNKEKPTTLFKNTLDTTLSDSEQWIENASNYDEFEAVSDEVSKEFKNWLKSIVKKLGKPLPVRKTKNEWTFINWISPDHKYKNDYSLWDKLVVGIRKLMGIEKRIQDKSLSISRIETMLSTALPKGLHSVWPYFRTQDLSNNLPQNIINRLNINCMPLNWGHGQLHYMFGDATEVQDLGNIQDHYVLLLQIASDEALSLLWGDVGILQIWIHAEDLEKGNFENITFTADCH